MLCLCCSTLPCSTMHCIKMPRNDKKFKCTPHFRFNSRRTLRIIFLFLAKMLANMCAKLWKNLLTGFWFMDFPLNWLDLGQSMHKQPGSNRVNLAGKKFKLSLKWTQSWTFFHNPLFSFSEWTAVWRCGGGTRLGNRRYFLF